MAQSIAYQHLRESCEASTLNLMLRNGNVGEPHPPLYWFVSYVNKQCWCQLFQD